MKKMRIVGIGGGTGLAVLLRGLASIARRRQDDSLSRLDITAIVCVSDDGGSSGWLRKYLGIPAVGDLRNCLAALFAEGTLHGELMQHRFLDGSPLEGHSLGNLVLAALCEMSGGLASAMERANQLFPSVGRVLPVSEEPLTLCARFKDQTVIRGEANIARAGKAIGKVWLEPSGAMPSAGVLEVIREADLVVLGPGSLYTSVIPNLLMPAVARAVRNTAARKILICNLMTQPGETDGFTGADHLRAINEYLGAEAVDVCLFNSTPITETRQAVYGQTGSEPVAHDPRQIESLGATAMSADLASMTGGKIRHSPERLAHMVLFLAQTERLRTGNWFSSATMARVEKCAA